MNAADRKAIHDAVDEVWTARPTGGTPRERQAWRNGFVDLHDAILAAVVLGLGEVVPDRAADRGDGRETCRRCGAGVYTPGDGRWFHGDTEIDRTDPHPVEVAR